MEPDSNTAEVTGLMLQAEQAMRVADLAAARHFSETAWSLAATDVRQRLHAQVLRARCDYIAGDSELALAPLLDAAEQGRAIGDAGIEALARALIARCLLAVRDTPSALDESLAALQLAESAERAEPGRHLRALQASLTAMSAVHLSLGQLENALEFCQRAVSCAKELGDAVLIGITQDTLGCVHSMLAERARDAGDAKQAKRLEREVIRGSTQAARLHRSAGHVVYEAKALANVAEALSKLGRHDQALALLEELSLRLTHNIPYVMAHLLDTRGDILMQLGRPAEARLLFEQALALESRSESAAKHYEHLAHACEAMGDVGAALAHYKKFHELYVQAAAEAAQRSARVATVQRKTAEAHARADGLARRNALVRRRADDPKRQSLEDALTGLANRRRTDQLLVVRPTYYAVALLDVDHFKHVNDTHSHKVGDEVLRRLGALLRSSCRADDTPARFGGEEFVVLMPETDAGSACGFAERLRAAVQAFDWGSVAEDLAVTISIGVAGPTEAITPGNLLALADQRLYAAKQGGRNRVVGA